MLHVDGLDLNPVASREVADREALQGAAGIRIYLLLSRRRKTWPIGKSLILPARRPVLE